MKINRHAKILDLISRDDIETQEELAEKLNAEGFPVTQATVSRDIREMKLTKVTNDRGRQVYKVMQGTETGMNEKYLRILRDGFVAMDMAQNILVVKTVAGMAMAVAAALDAMKWPEILGCIAGDDTIMLVVREGCTETGVKNALSLIIPNITIPILYKRNGHSANRCYGSRRLTRGLR